MPLGPVGIFGASNFPLAFSVLGNDTASALAAGCPVVVKGHPAHPQTSELAARIAAQALLDHGSPAGTFSLVHGQGAEVGRYLVQHPAIQGVGFTGSLAGGRALYDLAAARPAPIPVFAEMGSANPTLLLPRALEADPEGIARQFAASGLQGAGQFCTSPGLVFAVEGAGLDRFRSAAADHYAQGEAQPMLSEAVARHHETGRQSLAQTNHVRALNQPQGDTPQGWVRPALFETGVETLTNRPELGEEIFGPTALVLTCPDEAALIQAIARLEGHLAGSVFAADDDAKRFGEAITALRAKVGRLVFNAFATGAPLDRAIVHAGPYPATTPPFATSLGTQAALRFTRPVSFQNAPESALPPALHDANPWGIERRVAGTVTTDAL
jgi:acyl-CoA reductase-like NAD-dependent aldehyde dehydrogenase